MKSPATVLLESLADARRRGERFEEAWQPAVGVALAAARTATERVSWAEVFGDTASAWQRSFERQPAQRHETAVRALTDDGPAVHALTRPHEREIGASRAQEHSVHVAA